MLADRIFSAASSDASVSRRQDVYRKLDHHKLLSSAERWVRQAACDAGICEQDIKLAEFCGRLLDRGFRRGDVGRVGDGGERVRAEFFGGRLQGHPIAPGDRNLRALGNEHPRGRKADAAVAPGDQRCLVRKSHDA